jgi:hypothetical protein
MKLLKISSLIGICTLSLGLSTLGHAATVVIVKQPAASGCVQGPNYIVCYRAGSSYKYYNPYYVKRHCDQHGICYWEKCYKTIYGHQCYKFYQSNRLY